MMLKTEIGQWSILIAIIMCINYFYYFLLLNVHIKISLKRNVKQRFKQARHLSPVLQKRYLQEFTTISIH